MKHVTHKELQESFDQIPESSRREICDMIVALYTGYDVPEEFKFAVVHAYKCGLRDGGKREPLTEVPEHVLTALAKIAGAWDMKQILAALNADRAGEQPSPAPTAETEQYRKVEVGQHWTTVSDGIVVIIKDCGGRVNIGRPNNPHMFAGTMDKRHLVEIVSSAPAADHVKTPLDWANEEICELRSCLSMLIGTTEGDNVANYNAVRANTLELLRGTSHQSPAPAAEPRTQENKMIVTTEMVDRFLTWKLPYSVCADPCVSNQQEGRTGTNLLSAIEARVMLEHVLAETPAPAADKLRYANCCVCGRIIDTREESEGGDRFGCEVAGKWTCSEECWESIAKGDTETPAPAAEPTIKRNLKVEAEQAGEIDPMRFQAALAFMTEGSGCAWDEAIDLADGLIAALRKRGNQ